MTTQDEKIDAAALQRKLFPDDPLNKNQALTKNQFVLLLIDTIEAKIKQPAIERIFARCDTDGSGKITVEELAEYINNIDTTRPKSEIKRAAFVNAIKACVTSIPYYLTWGFLTSAAMGVTLNLVGRTQSIPPILGLITSYFSLCACIYFLDDARQRETGSYDLLLSTKKVLMKMVRESPLFQDDDASKQLIKDSTPDELTKQFLDDDGVDMSELNYVLERNGALLSHGLLSTIFKEIDTDKSGLVSLSELKEYAVTQNVDPTPSQRRSAILWAIFTAWDFHSDWTWFVGTIIYIVAGHFIYHEVDVSADVYYHMYGFGALAFVGCGVFLTPFPYMAAVSYLESLQRLRSALTIKGGSESEMFSMLDTRGEGDEGDGALDDGELYESLLDAGVLIPNDTFLKLFHEADTSKDGKLQVDEFILFLKKTEVPETKAGYAWAVVKQMPYTDSFLGAVMFTVGGILLVPCAYTSNPTLALNTCLVASCCYLTASLKKVFLIPMRFYKIFYRLHRGEMDFKVQMLASLKEISTRAAKTEDENVVEEEALPQK